MRKSFIILAEITSEEHTVIKYFTPSLIAIACSLGAHAQTENKLTTESIERVEVFGVQQGYDERDYFVSKSVTYQAVLSVPVLDLELDALGTKNGFSRLSNPF